jgi:hypothetical protein
MARLITEGGGSSNIPPPRLKVFVLYNHLLLFSKSEIHPQAALFL